MSWLITAKQYIPAVIGEPFGGGYFAGYISHTADGNPTHALIVAPRETGATGSLFGLNYTLTTNLEWKTTQTTTTGTDSDFDGAANTAAIVAAGINDHPAAKFCVDLTIGGFTDWYLPARLELDIAYFNLKPSTNLNTSSGISGINPYSVPQRSSVFTQSYPVQTQLTAWQANAGAQHFLPVNHFPSTEYDTTRAYRITMSVGTQSVAGTKTFAYPVRAFRRIAL